MPTRRDEQLGQDDFAPETHNDEQDDEQSQAQAIADEAISGSRFEAEPARQHQGRAAVWMTTSTQDLIDHMRDMEQSGRIDMGAYAGEENLDDNEDKYGEENRVDDLPSDGS